MTNIIVKDKKHDFYCEERKPDPCGIIIFGASGDLTRRKIVPALWQLYKRQLIPEHFFILGCSRSKFDDEAFRGKMREALKVHLSGEENEGLETFIKSCHYTSGDYHDPALYKALTAKLEKVEKDHAPQGGHIFYLATPPSLFSPISEQLHSAGLTREGKDAAPFTRIVIEKPFGHDLESALQLDKDLHRFIPESQIYRIDHYLGKETVQNIMMLRFANTVFEPVWNRQYIDNIQITAAESVGVGHRAGYYDQAGCLRDMFQNHIMQMLALVAQEPAASFDADRVRDEKVKLLRSIRPFNFENLSQEIIRGQYSPGKSDGTSVSGYLNEENIRENSMTETFVAARLFIDNWRWKGVPFYLRSGKRMPRKVTEIAITFKPVPHSMFSPFVGELPANTLVLNVQPQEGFALDIQAKHPGPKMCMSSLSMDFLYSEAFGIDMPDAYERLLLDCMQGDQTLFIRSDALEISWSLFTPVLEAWAAAKESSQTGPLHTYTAGSWGPQASLEMPEKEGFAWRLQ